MTYYMERNLFTMNHQHKVAQYRAIDLFAGIGGIRLGFQHAFQENIEFVFASEIDKYACETYYANYGEKPYGDITKIDEKNIPPFDILLGGFPCQAFSIAGLRKGFEDTRGTLFFEIARIVEHHKPQVVFLENVKGFKNHDKGTTFKVVKETLQNLGYKVFAEVLNAKDFGVPQNRERIYIIGFLDHSIEFEFPQKIEKKMKVFDILEKENVFTYTYNEETGKIVSLRPFLGNNYLSISLHNFVKEKSINVYELFVNFDFTKI